MSQPSALRRFLALYAALFAAFGVASPFFPAWLQSRGLDAQAVGFVLAAGTAVRIVAGPLGGRLADWARTPRLVLAGFLGAASGAALGYLGQTGVWPLLALSVLHAMALAPLTPIADALALRAGGFHYGWVRGAGSAAFIAGAALSGQVVERFGLDAILWMNAGLLAVAVSAAVVLPNQARQVSPGCARGALPELLALPGFMRLMLVAALVLGSHALHDGFEVIRWAEAGIGPGLAGLLWAEAVLAEVAVFLLLGPWLLARLGPGGALMLAAAAGVLRWAVEAMTAWWPAMALVQPLHGLTFALLHLACLQSMARIVPERLTATALAVYATAATGLVTALLSAVSGRLYGEVGAHGFWLMAALCGAALAIAIPLRRPASAVP